MNCYTDNHHMMKRFGEDGQARLLQEAAERRIARAAAGTIRATDERLLATVAVFVTLAAVWVRL